MTNSFAAAQLDDSAASYGAGRVIEPQSGEVIRHRHPQLPLYIVAALRKNRS